MAFSPPFQPARPPLPAKDGVKQFRNAILEEVKKELNKLYFSMGFDGPGYDQVLQTIDRLKI